MILLSSLLFGIAHLLNDIKSPDPQDWNWKLSFLAFLGGIPLGLTFFLTGNLLVPTLLHIVLIAILQTFKRF